MINSRLILDIGAHRGDDTNVYLQLGYSVVAVEANPELTEEMKLNYGAAMNSGKLKIFNFIIASKDDQQMKLYINTDASKSSIFGQDSVREISVTSRRLSSIISETGLPYYCKIDIEDSDLMAISSLNKDVLPVYISVEISGKPLSVLIDNRKFLFLTIDQLYFLGYKEFKLLDQHQLVVLPRNSFYKKNLKLTSRIKNKIKGMLSVDKKSKYLKKFKLSRDAEVSGPFGEHLEGQWLSYEETRRLIHFHFEEYVSVNTNTSFIFWIDIHAKR